MNYAVLTVPDFALHALRRHEPALARQPVALIAGEGRKAVLTQVSPEAAGLTPGLTVTLAMARCPGVVLRPRDCRIRATPAITIMTTSRTAIIAIRRMTCYLVSVEGAAFPLLRPACACRRSSAAIHAASTGSAASRVRHGRGPHPSRRPSECAR